jgi:signal-transduction protein with cAMP-binding, CBS, and nucleotidyltransferase domain
MRDPTVIQAKRFGIFSCRCNTSLLSVAKQMADEDISALVVVDDDGFLDGIITRMDLLRAQKAKDTWTEEPVKDWMTCEVVTVSPKDRLSHVATLLLEKQIHRVVAVQEENGKQRPVAVISAADLIYHLAKETY